MNKTRHINSNLKVAISERWWNRLISAGHGRIRAEGDLGNSNDRIEQQSNEKQRMKILQFNDLKNSLAGRMEGSFLDYKEGWRSDQKKNQ